MNDLILLGVGAFLAILGGSVSDELRSWRERTRERAAIKISIADELQGIETTVSNMHQVWEQAKVLTPSYVKTILQGTSAYDNLRPRLFLIKDKVLRKDISDFYKKLKDTALKAEGKLGTLADTAEANSEQASFDMSFQTLSAEAKALRGRLE
jgi:hypothetical protein